MTAQTLPRRIPIARTQATASAAYGSALRLVRPGCGARPWMPQAGGARFDLAAPEAGSVELRAVADGLAKQARWAGQTESSFYSVAQHSLHVADLMPETADGHLAGWALLHDGHEFAMGDVIAPVQAACAAIDPGWRRAWDTLADRLDAAIHAAIGLPWPVPPQARAIVDMADRMVAASEARDLLHDSVSAAAMDPAGGTAWRIQPTPWPDAADAWLARLRTLALRHGWAGPAIRALSGF